MKFCKLKNLIKNPATNTKTLPTFGPKDLEKRERIPTILQINQRVKEIGKQYPEHSTYECVCCVRAQRRLEFDVHIHQGYKC